MSRRIFLQKNFFYLTFIAISYIIVETKVPRCGIKKMASQKIVNSIKKAAEILKILSIGTDRITDLSNKLHVNKSTTHRLLKSLETSGLVTRDPVTRRYYLGPLIFELASQPIVAHQNLIVCAFEEMRYLRDFSRETVALYIPIGLERICIEELQSFEKIRFTIGKGSVAPLHVGSSSKVLLSQLEDNDLHRLVNHLNMYPLGPKTVTNKTVLLKEVEKVKKQGYATSSSELIKGGSSICVPIKGYVCPVALSVLGPENRLTLNAMVRVLEKMKESATRISKRLRKAK